MELLLQDYARLCRWKFCAHIDEIAEMSREAAQGFSTRCSVAFFTRNVRIYALIAAVDFAFSVNDVILFKSASISLFVLVNGRSRSNL